MQEAANEVRQVLEQEAELIYLCVFAGIFYILDTTLGGGDKMVNSMDKILVFAL